MIRTGTGDIDIAAGRDVQLLSQFSTIYTAGTKVAPGNLTNTTVNPGGVVNLAANLPVFFPNGTSDSSITSTVDGVVTIVNPASELQLPAGTVYSFAKGSGGGNSNNVQPIASRSTITATVLGATFNFPSEGGTISGFAPGATINVTSAVDMIASGPGVLYSNGIAKPFNAGDTLSPVLGSVTRIVLTSALAHHHLERRRARRSGRNLHPDDQEGTDVGQFFHLHLSARRQRIASARRRLRCLCAG